MLTLKVVLKGSNPPIWRRLQILDDATLGDLHVALQIVMGWTDSHLHEFCIGRERYSAMLPDEDDPESMLDEEEFALRTLLKRKGSKLEYTYDFGDDWLHVIVVEDVGEPQPGIRYPRCIAGERACPPEDCGGIDGYYMILRILQNPKHGQYNEYREWVPEDFDPEAFDLAQANEEFNPTSGGGEDGV